ncbi:MAG: helix-turn-helix domain-containing protein [Acidimicrobiales bacterium]
MILSSDERSDIDELLDHPGLAARLRTLRAARRLIAERGLGVSMSELAESAGVGRRTLFRHFDGRDELVAEALDSALGWYENVLQLETEADAPPDVWLERMVGHLLDVHHRSGRGLWQLTIAADAELPPALAAVNRRRREFRRTMTNSIATTAWSRFGGSGPVPAAVVDAVGLTISSFATHSLIDDLGRDLDAVVASTTAVLGAVLRAQASDTGRQGEK